MFPYERLKLLVLVPLSLGLAITVLTSMKFGYEGKAWTQQTIFFVNDGHCQPGEGIGLHCFGDFALPFAAVGEIGAFDKGHLAMSISSIMLLFIGVLKPLGFGTALYLYLGLSVAAICTPFLRKPQHVSRADQIVWLVLGGLLSLGSLASIDRGNNVALVVPFLFLYLVSLNNRKWHWVILSIVIISSIKVWGFYFVIGLIAFRKYRYAIISLFLSVIINVAGIAVMHLQGYRHSLHTKIFNTIEVILDKTYADLVSTYAISFSGLSKRIVCVFIQDGPCNLTLASQSAVGSSLVKLAILMASLSCVYVLTRNEKVPPYVWLTAITGLGVIAVPDAPIYNAVNVVAALGAIFLLSSDEGSGQTRLEKTWQVLTAIPIVASTISATVVHNTAWATSTVSGEEIWWRSYYFSVPIAWVVFYVGTLAVLGNQRRLSSYQSRSPLVQTN